jgi:hypothetical protein
MSPLARLRREQEGSMIALFAVVAFALLLVAAFVVDVGNWQEHRRHLQLQVAGTYFTNCFLDEAGSDTAITREAHKYAGDPDFTTTFPGNGPPYNLQVDDPARVVLNLNRPDWPPPETDYDPNYDLDPDAPDIQNKPCESRTLLIRAKDQDVPTFFGGVVPGPARLVDVRAKARVQINKVLVTNGFLPWAVPEIRPKTVAALFVNEDNPPTSNISLAAVLNTPTQTPLNGELVDLWARDGLSVGEGSGGVDYGLVVAISTRLYNDGDFAGKTLAQACSMTAVVCHTGSTQTSGLDFIHGYPKNMGSDGTPGGQVKLETVELVKVSGCDNSSPYFQWQVGCVFKLRAQIDFGALTPEGPAAEVRIQAPGAGCNGQGCLLTFDNGWWESGAVLSLPDGSGRHQIDITWHTGGGNNCNPPRYCGGTTKIMVPFAATDDQGAAGYVSGIRYVYMSTGAVAANSLGPGDHTVRVEVGLQPPLRVTQSEFDPPILLRLASRSGSLNQALDCDHPNITLEDEVRDGCQTYYKKNERDLVCSGNGGPTWTSSNLPPSTFIPTSGNLMDSPDCVAAKTGDVTSMAKGLHDRFEAAPASCPPNHWVEFRDALLNQQPLPSDPRYVTLIVTNFGAFSGSGATVVPVEFHAGFYITGWFHQQTAVGCPDNDLPPPPGCPTWPSDDGSAGCDPASNANKGNVWGYFVTAVLPVPGSIVSEVRCEFGELGTCAARLVE